MASNIYVPFNFAPLSVSVKTGSYTVPAGKYARAVVNLEGSATFTIGGVTALRGTQNSVLGGSNMYIATGSLNGGNTAGALFTGANSGTLSNAYSTTTDQKSLIAEIWLPSGTVINGTGTWRAVVTEYNNIT